VADDPQAAIAAAAKTAKMCAAFCGLSLLVLVFIMIVDNQIKRDLVGKVAEARRLVNDFGLMYGQVMNGGAAAGMGGDRASAGEHGGDGGAGVVLDAAGPAGDGGAVGADKGAPVARRSRAQGGPRGDG